MSALTMLPSTEKYHQHTEELDDARLIEVRATVTGSRPCISPARFRCAPVKAHLRSATHK